MAARGNARVSIIGDASSLQRASKQGENALEKLSRSGTGHFSKLAKAAAGAAVAYVGISEAKTAINVTEDLAKSTLGLSRALGLSVTEASRWAAVARARGIDNKALMQSFGTLSKNVEAGVAGYDKQGAAIKKQGAELDKLGTSKDDVAKRDAILARQADLAAKGAGAQAEAFKKLGISQDELKTGDFNTILGKAADGLGKLKGGTERAAVAQKLFGRGWQTIVPLMNDGSKGMREQLALADKYGVTFQGKTVKSVKELIGAQREAKFATMGFQLALGTALIPALTKGLTTVNGFVKGMRDGTGAGGKFADKAREIAADLKPVATWLLNAGKEVASFTAKHKSVQNMAIAVAGVGAAIKALKFLSAVTGFNNIVKAGKFAAAKLVPIFAAEGAAAGTAAGNAAAGGKGLRGTAGKMTSAGSFLGTKFGTAFKLAAGVGIASVIAQLADVENADPLLFLHPPAAGEDPKTEKEKLAQAEAEGKAGVPDIANMPALTKKPKNSKKSMVTPGASSTGSSVTARTSSVARAAAPVAKASTKTSWPRGMYSQSDMAELWAAANPGNGDPALMAAIGMAESGGNSSIVNSIGAGGLWQIHPPEANYLDPWTNAKIAGRKLRTQGLGAWEAYTGPDGKGSDGPYQAYAGKSSGKSTIGSSGVTAAKKKKTPTVTLAGGHGNIPGVGGANTAGEVTSAPDFTPIESTTAADWIGGLSGVLDAEGVGASLTKDTADDLLVAGRAVRLWKGLYEAAVKSGNLANQVDYGGRLKGAQDQLEALTPAAPGPEDFLNADVVKASLTTDTKDDVTAGTAVRDYFQGKYNAAAAANDPLGIVEWGQKLKGANDALEALTQAVTDNTATLQAQNDLLKQQADAANRRAALAQSETASLGRAFLDWMSGELGGRIGPGFQTPAAAGVSARY